MSNSNLEYRVGVAGITRDRPFLGDVIDLTPALAFSVPFGPPPPPGLARSYRVRALSPGGFPRPIVATDGDFTMRVGLNLWYLCVNDLDLTLDKPFDKWYGSDDGSGVLNPLLAISGVPSAGFPFSAFIRLKIDITNPSLDGTTYGHGGPSFNELDGWPTYLNTYGTNSLFGDPLGPFSKWVYYGFNQSESTPSGFVDYSSSAFGISDDGDAADIDHVFSHRIDKATATVGGSAVTDWVGRIVGRLRVNNLFGVGGDLLAPGEVP